MTKPHATSTSTVVRDTKTGRLVTVLGAGALKGLPLRKGVDLTKPIASQALKGDKPRRLTTAKS
jgi:hypothetical protein